VSPLAQVFVLRTRGRIPRPVPRVGRYTFLSSPVYSHDGRLAFAAQRCPRCSHLLLVVSRNRVRRVTTNAVRVVWYPRRHRLLFVRAGRLGTTLHAVDSDGRRLRPVVAEADPDDVSSIDTPAVSANGKWIAYSRELEPSESREIFVRALAGGRERQITRLPRPAVEPAFSPDGRKIAFACQLRGMVYGICVARTDGTRRTVLTHGPDDHNPTFAPDGRTIVFSSTRGAAAFALRSLWSVRTDGHGLRRLTRGADDSEPAFSADGGRLVFVRRRVRFVEVPGA
jgi:dipeptidyl aminopeptidase/acylaminoacyl peptidase